MAPRSLSILLILALAACSGRYMGIDRGSLDPSTQAWFDKAMTGDKHAQFELGMIFARGDAVPQDCVRARKLLRQAASRTGGTIWVYSPPVTKGGAGRVVPIDQGPLQAGLQTAKEALHSLDESGPCRPA
ncbi:hypothetical protein ACXYN8_11620 [Altererythrobacter sp. CAU 1778]